MLALLKIINFLFRSWSSFNKILNKPSEKSRSLNKFKSNKNKSFRNFIRDWVKSEIESNR